MKSTNLEKFKILIHNKHFDTVDFDHVEGIRIELNGVPCFIHKSLNSAENVICSLATGAYLGRHRSITQLIKYIEYKCKSRNTTLEELERRKSKQIPDWIHQPLNV